MNLSLFKWKNTPWGRASIGQWRYALRNSIAMCLALWIAFSLNLDQPSWALTSAAVVNFPTIGGVISKSLGRIIGSFIGALVSLIIAGNCLNDPWLFTFFIAGWIGLCTFAANHYQNNVAYAFSLAGYTTAIIAFSIVNTTSALQIFDIAQARVCEVITGILCGGLMMMILPSTSDGDTLLSSLRHIHQQLLKHATLLWQADANLRIQKAHEGIINQILTMDVLRIQAFWSHYRLRSQNNILNFLLHQQLHLTAIIASLREMLINLEKPPENLLTVLTVLLAELKNEHTDKYTLAKLLQQISPQNNKRSDYRYTTFWLQLRTFCWVYLSCHHWLERLEQTTPISFYKPPPVSQLARYTDSYEAAYNGLRAFLCILLGAAFWINTGWSAGSSALTLIAISSVLYATTPSPIKNIMTLFQSIALLSITCFILHFGLMIQLDSLSTFCLFLFPILVTMQMMKLQHPNYATLWGQLIVYIGSFLAITNPPTYDYLTFINNNIGKLIGVLFAASAFQILRPSSDKRKSKRIIRALRHDFIDQLSLTPQHNKSQFESITYHRINHLGQSQDQIIRNWLLSWGVALLNCSHVIWRLRDWQTTSTQLALIRDISIHCLKGIMSEAGLEAISLKVALVQLQKMHRSLAKQSTEEAQQLAGLIWRLQCALSQLQQDTNIVLPKAST